MGLNGPTVAFFSMEVSLAPDMPTYAGGLGVLAGTCCVPRRITALRSSVFPSCTARGISVSTSTRGETSPRSPRSGSPRMSWS